MIGSIMTGLEKNPSQLQLVIDKAQGLINKNKLLRFVRKRDTFYQRLTDDDIKDQNVFKDVYMKRKEKNSYFELLKQRRVEVYFKNQAIQQKK